MKDALGKAAWDGFGWVAADGLKVLEWEYVGAGVTGPMDRREAAKWGSRPSMSMAIVLVWLVVFFCSIVALAASFLGNATPGGLTYHSISLGTLAHLTEAYGPEDSSGAPLKGVVVVVLWIVVLVLLRLERLSEGRLAVWDTGAVRPCWRPI